MSDFAEISANVKKKSFWERKEGTFGMGFLAIMAVGAVIVLDKIIPFILNLAQNMFFLALFLCLLAVMVYVGLNPKTWQVIGMVFQLTMRKITGTLIMIDPIGILKERIAKMAKRRDIMDAHMGDLNGQVNGLSAKVKEGLRKAERHLERAAYLKKNGASEGEIALEARSAAREQESAQTLSMTRDKLLGMYEKLKKVREIADFVIKDNTHLINLKEDEYKAIKSAYGVVNSVKAILNGEANDRETYEAALDFLADDMNAKIGDIDDFMDRSKEILSGVNTDMGILGDKGLKMLEEWEQQGTLLLSSSSQKPVGVPVVNLPKVELITSSNVSSKSKFLED